MKNFKYTIGLPFISKAYKAKTPKNFKMVGDTLIFVGGAVALVAQAFTPPGWVLTIGGLATLTGRFVIKCIGETSN